MFHIASTKQLDEFIAGEGFDGVGGVFTDDFFHAARFLFDEGVDAVFDGIFGDEFEDLDAARLADAVDAVGGLVFFGGVPPAVVVDDDGSFGEVDTEAAGLEGGGEDFAGGIFSEAGDRLFSVGGGAAKA